MFIGKEQYFTDLSEINNIRHALFTTLYSDYNIINNLMEIVGKYIELLGISYNPNTYTITVNIKKTSIKKQYGCKFNHDPNFYYQFIPSIFREFLTVNKDRVVSVLANMYPSDPNEVFNAIINGPLLNNLCHITCLSDKVLEIRL